MKRIAPEVMELRRRERLRSLNFFMTDARVPRNAREVFAKGACLNLLQGWFDNSRWRTALYVLKDAFRWEWEERKQGVWFFWQRKVMRRTPAEIERLLDAES